MSGKTKKSLPRVRPKSKPQPADGEVGYKNPPRDHTWKPGQSGNPKGRRKGSKNESTILREILEHKIKIRGPNGRVRTITVMEAIHRKLADRAVGGDLKAAGFLLDRYGGLVSGEVQPKDMSEDDRAVLDDFIQQAIAGKADGEQP
jgi:hypothetical protein